ncbi:YfhJ family protein [Lysinibacillus sp. MHQ-1]|nr:YfhJ family protein [Lysinibacillus sp. MHQ-1]
MRKNPQMSVGRARVWVELLWSDFESTSAKAGHDYRGPDYTENLVRQLITSYGDKLHAFAGRNPKYAHLLDASDDMIQ